MNLSTGWVWSLSRMSMAIIRNYNKVHSAAACHLQCERHTESPGHMTACRNSHHNLSVTSNSEILWVTGFQCHSVPVNSGECSGEITGILKFHGRSEILAGKFHWNGTGMCRNDRNPAGICGASLRPPSEGGDDQGDGMRVALRLCNTHTLL